MEQLVLQGFGACGNDDLATGQHGWHQISHSLAGAGAGLANQRGAIGNGLGNTLRHGALLRTFAIAADAACQRTLGRKYLLQPMRIARTADCLPCACRIRHALYPAPCPAIR